MVVVEPSFEPLLRFVRHLGLFIEWAIFPSEATAVMQAYFGDRVRTVEQLDTKIAETLAIR